MSYEFKHNHLKIGNPADTATIERLQQLFIGIPNKQLMAQRLTIDGHGAPQYWIVTANVNSIPGISGVPNKEQISSELRKQYVYSLLLQYFEINTLETHLIQNQDGQVVLARNESTDIKKVPLNERNAVLNTFLSTFFERKLVHFRQAQTENDELCYVITNTGYYFHEDIPVNDSVLALISKLENLTSPMLKLFIEAAGMIGAEAEKTLRYLLVRRDTVLKNLVPPHRINFHSSPEKNVQGMEHFLQTALVTHASPDEELKAKKIIKAGFITTRFGAFGKERSTFSASDGSFIPDISFGINRIESGYGTSKNGGLALDSGIDRGVVFVFGAIDVAKAATYFYKDTRREFHVENYTNYDPNRDPRTDTRVTLEHATVLIPDSQKIRWEKTFGEILNSPECPKFLNQEWISTHITYFPDGDRDLVLRGMVKTVQQKPIEQDSKHHVEISHKDPTYLFPIYKWGSTSQESTEQNDNMDPKAELVEVKSNPDENTSDEADMLSPDIPMEVHVPASDIHSIADDDKPQNNERQIDSEPPTKIGFLQRIRGMFNK